MKQYWDRIEAWLAANAKPLKAALAPGASDEEIDQAEEEIGLKFPADLRASLKIHNGEILPAEDAFMGVLGGQELLSLRRIVEDWNYWTALHEDGELEEFEAYAEGPVKPLFWNPRWIPISFDGEGDALCLDMDPDEGGVVGQVIEFWQGMPPRTVVAESFEEWLLRYAEELEAGEYEIEIDKV